MAAGNMKLCHPRFPDGSNGNIHGFSEERKLPELSECRSYDLWKVIIM